MRLPHSVFVKYSSREAQQTTPYPACGSCIHPATDLRPVGASSFGTLPQIVSGRACMMVSGARTFCGLVGQVGDPSLSSASFSCRHAQLKFTTKARSGSITASILSTCMLQPTDISQPLDGDPSQPCHDSPQVRIRVQLNKKTRQCLQRFAFISYIKAPIP